jgi:hypothetical protein
MYYTKYYSYQHDPKFWVDVTFMPVFDRVNGRQIETIFFEVQISESDYGGKDSRHGLFDIHEWFDCSGAGFQAAGLYAGLCRRADLPGALVTTTFMALVVALLLNRIRDQKPEEQQ